MRCTTGLESSAVLLADRSQGISRLGLVTLGTYRPPFLHVSSSHGQIMPP